jgi:pimeloyl-ACP methyl ester carboxylesterase
MRSPRRNRTLVTRTLAIAIGLAVAACSSTSPETPTPTDAAEQTPSRSDDPVEGLFDVGAHRLYMECRETGSPTVVFLHGVGGQASDWGATLADLTDMPTCNYDRLNVGRSDLDPGRHQAIDSVEDLEALLGVAEVEPPYLLVGHSFGGMIALLYAANHPDDVAGILLVDATLPLEAELDPPKLVDDIKAELDDNDEHLDFYEAFGQVGAELDRLPPIPITYLFGALQDLPPEWERGAYVESLHAFIDGLPRGRLVEEDSGHAMPIEIPEEIAAQIRTMFEAIGA